MGDPEDGLARDLAAVAFADPGRGVVAGDAGTILTTTSGGVVDATAPKTTATGLQTGATKGWRHTTQTVTLKATDAGSGVAATYYTVDGGARQTYAGPFDIAAAGSHVVKYWSADWAGNVETKRTGYVNIDLSKPVCKAIGNITAYTGTSVKFTFKVTDAKPTCGAGSVRISIQKNGQTKQRITISRTTFNVAHSRSAVVKLAAGQYTWVVTATDLAGNVQKTKGHARLTLKKMPLPTLADVQRRLIQLKYLPSGAVTGKADYRTSQALMAFQAWNDLTRDGVAGVQTRKKLATASVPTPRPVSAGGHSVQIYRSLGVALCIDNGTLVRAVHCSTGRPGLETTAGTWSRLPQVAAASGPRSTARGCRMRASSTTARGCTGTGTCPPTRPRTAACACRCPRRRGCTTSPTWGARSSSTRTDEGARRGTTAPRPFCVFRDGGRTRRGSLERPPSASRTVNGILRLPLRRFAVL